MSSLRLTRPLRSWLFAVVAILATTAQLAVALAPLAEGRGTRTFSAHVEQGGTRSHAAHNEATCASCQARSIHGTTSRPPFTLPAESLAAFRPSASTEVSPRSAFHVQSSPRAPPYVI